MGINISIQGFGRRVAALLALFGADPAVVQTRWGVRLSPGGAFGALLARVVGLGLFGVISWIWGRHGVPVDPVLAAMQLGLTGFLFATGWLLFWHGWDVRPTEAQIDLKRREFRLGYMTVRGWFAPKMRIPLGQIADIVIIPAAKMGGQAALYARLGNGRYAFELMTGSPAQLASIRHQILAQLKAVPGAFHRDWAV